MKVRLVTRMAGPDGVVQPGREAEVSAEAAAELVAGGYAEYVDAPVPAPSEGVETATSAPRETAVSRRGGRSKSKRKKEATDGG